MTRIRSLHVARSVSALILAATVSCGSGEIITPSPVVAIIPGQAPDLVKGAGGEYWVRGVESASLLASVKGTVAVTRPVGGVERIELPGLASTYAREPRGPGSGPASLAVAGPDRTGAIVFVDDDIVAKTHRFLRVAPGGATVVVSEGAGSAMFTELGEQLALDPAGERLAYVLAPAHVPNNGASAYYEGGEIGLCTVRDGMRMRTGVDALDDALAWTADGRRLVYACFVDREQALRDAGLAFRTDRAFNSGYDGWSRLPVVCFLDPATGAVEPICIGQHPILSTDGATLIVRDVQAQYRKVDVAARTWVPLEMIGGTYPGPIAFVDDDVVLYPAWPTIGEDARWQAGSPIARDRQDRTLKLVRLSTGEFATVARAISPHDHVSFGPR